MDSKHRHELMQNELADWIGKLPELVKQNRNQIIGIVLVVVGLISWPILNKWKQGADFAAESQVSDKIAAAEMAKYIAMSSYAQTDPNASAAGSLLVAANNLADEAKTAPSKDLAALALVKQGQALRAELILKKEMVPQDVVNTQIKQAQDAYQEALSKATLPSIRAMAQLGLALCSEELGQLEQAKDLYKKIIDDAAYAGLPFVKMAQTRIDNMGDNNAKYSFVDIPKPATAENMPKFEMDAAPAPVPAPAQPAAIEPNAQTK